MIFHFNPDDSPAKRLEHVEEVCSKLANLLRSDGWKLFEEYVRRDAKMGLDATRGRVLDPVDALRTLTAHNVAVQIVEWPMLALREGEAIRQQTQVQLAEEKQRR